MYQSRRKKHLLLSKVPKINMEIEEDKRTIDKVDFIEMKNNNN